MRPVLVMLGSKNMIMCRSDRSISSSCTSDCFYFAAYYFWQLRLISGLIFFELKHNLDGRRSIWSSTLKGHPLRRTLAYKTVWSCLWVLNSVLEHQFYPVGPNNTQSTWVSMATMVIVKLLCYWDSAMEKSCILLFGKLCNDDSQSFHSYCLDLFF